MDDLSCSGSFEDYTSEEPLVFLANYNDTDYSKPPCDKEKVGVITEKTPSLAEAFPKSEPPVSEELERLFEHVRNLPPEQQKTFLLEGQESVAALKQGKELKTYILPTPEDSNEKRIWDNVPLPENLILSKDWDTHEFTKDLPNNLEKFKAVWQASIDAGMSRETIRDIDPDAIKKVKGYCRNKKELSYDDVLPKAKPSNLVKIIKPERKIYLNSIIHPEDKKLIYQLEHNRMYGKSNDDINAWNKSITI